MQMNPLHVTFGSSQPVFFERNASHVENLNEISAPSSITTTMITLQHVLASKYVFKYVSQNTQSTDVTEHTRETNANSTLLSAIPE